MRIFFAGAINPYSKVVAKHGGDALLSYANPNSIYKYWELNNNKKIFLDSGAFTAFTQGKSINIDEYIDFIKKHKDLIEIYAALDVIGDWKATVKNTEYMEARGLKPLPVFHFNSPDEELHRLCSKYDYIALGGLVPIALQKNRMKQWLDHCFSILRQHWVVKTHGFGITATWALERYPFYSVDSTSYLQSSRFGSSHFVKNQQIISFNNKTKHHLERTEIEVIGLMKKMKRITDLWTMRGITWK